MKTTRTVYPFAGLQVEITQKKPLQRGSDQYCRAEVRVVKGGSVIAHRLFPNFEPNGDTYGLFVPKMQPSSDYFLIVKRGDYDGRTLLIDKNGQLKDLPGGTFWVVPDKGLLFSNSVQDSDQGPVIFDLRSGAVVHDQLPFCFAHWYRNGEVLFFTTYVQDGSGKEDRSLIHVYQPTVNKISDEKPGQEIWKDAKIIDGGFDPADQNISCGTKDN
jgi:hypothetical protein